MKKSSVFDNKRLSSAMNPRFDLVAPKRELENAEKQIEKVRREAQKSFEREKQQLQKKLETLPATKRSMPESAGVRKYSRNQEPPQRLSVPVSCSSIISDKAGQSLSTSEQMQCSRDSICVDNLGPDELALLMPVDKQAEALRQLKFLYDCAMQLVAGAEAAHRAPSRQRGGMGAELEDFGDEKQIARVTAKDSSVEDPAKGTGRKDSVYKSGQRHISFSSDSSPFTSSVRRQISGPSTSMVMDGGQTMAPSMEFQGPPSPAVQLMSMVRMLAMGQTMDTKQMKALTSVIEESRTAVKSVKSGSDPERAQEKLVKKLNDLLDMVKPKGSDLIISPEELLRCSYLRLSKDNITRLEEMIRERGMDPGIHCHSDMQAYMEKLELGMDDDMPRGLPTMPLGETSNIQPVSVFLTKAGAPIDKTRTTKPDNVPGPSMEEEMARLKKFRAS